VAVVLDTSSSVPDRRLAVWQDIVCDTFVGARLPVGHAGTRSGGSVFAISGRACDVYTRSIPAPRGCSARPSRIARAPARISCWWRWENSGVNGVYQDGREAVVSAGQFTIYDTTRPYELRFDDSFSQTILQMPRKLLQQRIGAFDKLTATTFSKRSSPSKAWSTNSWSAMSKTIDHVDPVTATRLLGPGAGSGRDGVRRQNASAFAGSVVATDPHCFIVSRTTS